MSLEKALKKLSTPQTQPLKGREGEMLKNKAGGFVFKLNKEEHIKRFLILGTEGGTYYVSEMEHTLENFLKIRNYLNENPELVIKLVAELTQNRQILKKYTAIATIAIAWIDGHREPAEKYFNQIVTIPTDLFMFLKFIKILNNNKVKVGRKLRRMIANWYHNNDNLVYQVLKYQSRHTFSHKDVLKLTHIKAINETEKELFAFLVEEKYDEKFWKGSLLEAFVKLRQQNELEEILKIIHDYNVTWEFVPSHYLSHPEVWETLLPKLPITALVRNLGRLTALEITNKKEELILKKLQQKAPTLPPLRLGLAWITYANGKGYKSKLRWKPSPKITDALSSAFINSFKNVKPLNSDRIVLAIDGSGSMCWSSYNGMSICKLAVLTAMPIILANKKVELLGFDRDAKTINTWKNQTGNLMRFIKWLELKIMKNFGGGTDVAAPIKYALHNNIKTDTFIILTDEETWAGNQHVIEAIQEYRNYTGINARLIIGSLTATHYTNVDPRDPLSLNIIGFDTEYYKIIDLFLQQTLEVLSF